MPTINIKINKDGTVTVKGEGFWGEECRQPIEEIVNKLGVALEEKPLCEETVKIIKK